MTTGFQIPEVTSAPYAQQAAPDSADFSALAGGFAAYGVISGCAVSAQGSPNMTVAVGSGSALVLGTTVAVSAGNVTILPADSALPRLDLITVNASGVLASIAGIPAISPVCATLPSGQTLLAIVYVPAGSAAILSTMITDKRIIFVQTASVQTRPRLFVASSTAPAAIKAKADYVCTGTADNTVIQQAITALQTTGGLVELSEGSFNLAASLTVSTSEQGIVGQGWATVLSLSNAVNDYAIKFTPGATLSITGALFRDFAIQANGGNQTAESGGINGFGAVQCVFDHLFINQPRDAGIKCNSDGNGGTGHHNRITNCLITNGQSAPSGAFGRGIWLTASDENFVANCDIESCGRSGSTDPAGIAEYSGLQNICNCVFVGCQEGIKVQGNYTKITSCMFDGCKANNVQVNGSGCVITGCTFYQIGAGSGSPNFDGVKLDNVQNCTVTGCAFFSDNTGTESGINVANGSTGASISGNTFTSQGGGFGASNNQQILLSGSGHSISGNAGLSSSGTATIAGSTTSIVVSHGLVTTPTRVLATPTANPGAVWWVDTLTSTQFTLHLASAPGGGVTFNWHAQIGEG